MLVYYTFICVSCTVSVTMRVTMVKATATAYALEYVCTLYVNQACHYSERPCSALFYTESAITLVKRTRPWIQSTSTIFRLCPDCYSFTRNRWMPEIIGDHLIFSLISRHYARC